MAKRTLDEILENDDLIDVPEPAAQAASEDDRIRDLFEEINRFVDTHGHAPGENSDGTGQGLSAAERSLFIRLKHYRDSAEISQSLSSVDRHGLLVNRAVSSEGKSSEAKTLDDILSSDDDILSSEYDDIFNLKHVKPKKMVDFTADRRPCSDFHLYKPLLDACARDIADETRKTMRFANEQDISPGDFFILNGILVYVAEVRDEHIRYGKRDARLLCVFDNGTESDMLLRSLASQLYSDRNGRRVSSPEAGPLFGSQTQEGDVRKGCVYIASSLSANPAIAGMKNLYKIGVTTGRPERRIRRAERDPTFLMAPAKLVKSFAIYNADPSKVESILHAFFCEVALGVEIKDRFDRPIKPREWFVAPLAVIDEAIKLLFEGTINSYEYDPITQSLRRRANPPI